jgi:hypothetical protein
MGQVKRKETDRSKLRQCSHCCEYFNYRTLKGAAHLAGCRIYNGHTNYETWLVSLWIDNDEGTYNHWREEAAECREEAKDDHHGFSSISPERRAVYLLGKRLKESFEEGATDQAGTSGVYKDLLSAAISEVDWDSIAESKLTE